MKKNVALLLVLSMLMSMLPMNVVGNAAIAMPGASVTGWLVSGGENGDAPNMASQTNLTVHLPVAAFAGRQLPMQLNLRLDHAYVQTAADFNKPDGTPWGVTINNPVHIGVNMDLGARVTTASALVGGFNPQRISATLTATQHNWHSWGEAMIRIDYDSNIPVGNTGTIAFDIPVRGWTGWQGAELSLTSAADGISFIQGWRLVGAPTRSVAWSVTGGLRGFSSALPVPPLRITENQFGTLYNGAFTEQMAVMLTAPPFYNWAFMPPGGTVVSEDIITTHPGISYPLQVSLRPNSTNHLKPKTHPGPR